MKKMMTLMLGLALAFTTVSAFAQEGKKDESKKENTKKKAPSKKKDDTKKEGTR